MLIYGHFYVRNIFLRGVDSSKLRSWSLESSAQGPKNQEFQSQESTPTWSPVITSGRTQPSAQHLKRVMKHGTFTIRAHEIRGTNAVTRSGKPLPHLYFRLAGLLVSRK